MVSIKKGFYLRLIISFAALAAVTGLGLGRIFASRPRTAAAVRVPGRDGAVLVIDPGHGGADGGAVSVTGTYESRLNLEIALRARALAALFGVPAEMTRESELLDYPEDAGTVHAKKVWDTKTRTELINSFDSAFLISIHQNKYTTPSPHGSQVFFAPTEGSRELAESLQELLAAKVTGESRRTAAQIGESVYIMNHVNCPAVLVECGFLSNAIDAGNLEDESYQKKLAVVIIGGYLAGSS